LYGLTIREDVKYRVIRVTGKLIHFDSRSGVMVKNDLQSAQSNECNLFQNIGKWTTKILYDIICHGGRSVSFVILYYWQISMNLMVVEDIPLSLQFSSIILYISH